MRTYTAYRLKFKTQLHLGRTTGPAQTGKLGLEKTEIYIPADTLFSAICQTWATFYDPASLTDFLNQYTAKGGSLPFTLTSAFPFADNVYFFPKPLTLRESKDTPEKVKTEAKKKIKKLQFVSGNLFQRIISGHLPEFSPDKPIATTLNGEEIYLMNSEKIWVNAEENKHLREALFLNNETENEEINIWQTPTRPRVTIGSRNASSEIWHLQTVQFNKKCGLWFAADFDNDETKHKIETLLRVLGDNGIGGERNAGYGAFDFDTASIEIPDAQGSNQSMTLSPICPKSADQLEHLLKGDVAYTLTSSSGWVSTPGTVARRKQVNMFAEGSVLNTCDEPVGRLVDLKPDNWAQHPVYRYGYAWQVGIKGTPNETKI